MNRIPADQCFDIGPHGATALAKAAPAFVKIRPVDLYVTKGYRRPGVVLVGDAFATSCPAAGTGARKVLVDVERLCNVHIRRWLETPGMSEEKIAAFYEDPVKQASVSIDPSLQWSARRWIKFVLHWGRGTLRSLLTPQPPVRDNAESDMTAGVASTPQFDRSHH